MADDAAAAARPGRAGYRLGVISAAGVYAQLVAAHVGDRGATASALASRQHRGEVGSQIHIVADIDRRLVKSMPGWTSRPGAVGPRALAVIDAMAAPIYLRTLCL